MTTLRALLLAAGALGVVLVASAVLLRRADARFHREFLARADETRRAAGRPAPGPLTEADLQGVPDAIARWVRFSGAVGKERISAVRVVHSGTFRPSPKGGWVPIHGEYVITTNRPSFHWYGKIAMRRGLTIAAADSYDDGHGRMLVKALSAFTLVDARTPQTDQSAFGRCIAELTLAPTFFLDRRFVRCAETGALTARCTVEDGRFSTTADLAVNDDGSLDRIVVMRFFDDGGGNATLEKFTGKASRPRDLGGRRVPSRIDGIWNLRGGDLHYASFDLDDVTFE